MNGLELITPTSINYTGTSASIGSNGVVTTTGTTSISLNGVFSASHDHYMVTFNWLSSTLGQTRLEMRLRATTDRTGYNFQRLWLDSVYQYPTRTLGATRSYFLWRGGSMRGFAVAYFYSPFASAPTPYSLTAYDDLGNAAMDKLEGIHTNTNSMDGFTIAELTFGYPFDIEIAVYGMVK